MSVKTDSRNRTCGLDFGTSNSTLALQLSNQPALVPLENGELTIPSAVFFGFKEEDAFLVGRAAMQAYLDGAQGRLLRSLKSILGSSLIAEKTQVYKQRVAFSEIIRRYISELKHRAETQIGGQIDSVVLGRPVHFVDNNEEADQDAENTLREIATEIGFKEISFQFEPVAAGFEFERTIQREHLVFVADIGGGTSDFTVVRLSPDRHLASDRTTDLLANDGLRLGGTDYDKYLSMASFMPVLGYKTLQKRGDIQVPTWPYWDLSTWTSVHNLYDPKRIADIKSIKQSAQQPEIVDRLLRVVEQGRAHSMLIQVEEAKIHLSTAEQHLSDLGWNEPGLEVRSTRERFEQSTERLYERLKVTAAACVKSAGIDSSDISAVMFTGGTSQVSSVRDAIASNFPQAQIVDGDRFGSVGLGLAIEAQRRYG